MEQTKKDEECEGEQNDFQGKGEKEHSHDVS